jgi:hypothetical protein
VSTGAPRLGGLVSAFHGSWDRRAPAVRVRKSDGCQTSARQRNLPPLGTFPRCRTGTGEGRRRRLAGKVSGRQMGLVEGPCVGSIGPGESATARDPSSRGVCPGSAPLSQNPDGTAPRRPKSGRDGGCGKPWITPRTPFCVKHLHQNSRVPGGLDAPPRTVDNHGPPIPEGGSIGGSAKKMSTNEPGR